MSTNIPAALCPEAAASYLSLSVSTLAKLRLSGMGPAYCKLGRRVAYRLEDLDVWFFERRRQSTSDLGDVI